MSLFSYVGIVLESLIIIIKHFYRLAIYLSLIATWMEVVWANRFLRVENDRSVFTKRFHDRHSKHSVLGFRRGDDRCNNIPSFVFFLLLSPWSMHIFDGMMHLQPFGYYLPYFYKLLRSFLCVFTYLSIDLAYLYQVTDVTLWPQSLYRWTDKATQWTMADINKSAKLRTLRHNFSKKSF